MSKGAKFPNPSRYRSDPWIWLLKRSKEINLDWNLMKLGNFARLQEANILLLILEREDMPKSVTFAYINKSLCERSSVVRFLSLCVGSIVVLL